MKSCPIAETKIVSAHSSDVLHAFLNFPVQPTSGNHHPRNTAVRTALQHKHHVLQSKPATNTETKKNVRVPLTCWTSIPRASKSVVISTREEPERNSRIITSRSPWPMSPCMHEMVKSRSCSTRGASEISQQNGRGERAFKERHDSHASVRSKSKEPENRTCMTLHRLRFNPCRPELQKLYLVCAIYIG